MLKPIIINHREQGNKSLRSKNHGKPQAIFSPEKLPKTRPWSATLDYYKILDNQTKLSHKYFKVFKNDVKVSPEKNFTICSKCLFHLLFVSDFPSQVTLCVDVVYGKKDRVLKQDTRWFRPLVGLSFSCFLTQFSHLEVVVYLTLKSATRTEKSFKASELKYIYR